MYVSMCVCDAGCPWDTEELSLWGSTQSGKQGSQVEVVGCQAREFRLQPGSGEKPQRGLCKDMTSSCKSRSHEG